MSFGRAYSYHNPRQASAVDTNRLLESAPPFVLSPSNRTRTAATPSNRSRNAATPSNRSRQQSANGVNTSPLLLETDNETYQPHSPLSIDASTPHASHVTFAAGASDKTTAPAHRSYIDSLLATPRPGYTPTKLISPAYWKIFMSNFRTLFTLAWPVILSYLLQFSQGIVNLVFIGHISAEKLAAAALGNMYANITGYAVAFGLATAVDTLCSQAYGAGNMKLIGLVVQRSACIMVLTSIPIFIMWWYCADLLIMVKQDPEISADAGVYVWRLAPSLIPYLLFELTKKYLIAQRIMKPMIFILLATSVIHVLLVYLFTYPLDMGFLGPPTATMAAQYLMLLIGLAVIYFRGIYKETWPGLSMEILNLQGWFAILRFGLPGMLMLCLEWWSFELCALAAGWMGAIQLDSFVVLLQVQSLIFMIPLGLSIAISTVTGNRLGAGQPELAKQGAGVAIFIGLVTQTLVAVILILARSQIGQLFSSDEKVVELVAEVFPITGVMLLFDAMQVVCGGVLRGIGFQSIGAATNLIGFYLFGLPLAGVLWWQNWQVKGLVLGLLVATTITASVFVTTIVRVDWEKESHKAVERTMREKMAQDALSDEQVDEPQQQQQISQPLQFGGAKSAAGKTGKEFYESKEESKSGGETELAQTTVAPVQDYHTLAIDDEMKEQPSRPLALV